MLSEDLVENFYNASIAQGHLTYLMMSVHLANPKMLTNIVDGDPSRLLLCSMVFGNTILIYSKEAMKPVRKNFRFIFSLCGSLMFNTASVKTFSWFNTLFPKRTILASLLALITGKLMYSLFDTYLCYVDTYVEGDSKKKSEIEYLWAEN